mgnify:CR=1 FL=1
MPAAPPMAVGSANPPEMALWSQGRIYAPLVWRQLGVKRMAAEIWSATPAGFWYISSFALVLGTFQGLLQVLPATVNLFTSAEEVPNIHAQLNMVGGVLLALIGEPDALALRKGATS